MTPEEYFKKWSENCRIFENYKPIHNHADMMQFAKDYHAEQLRIGSVSKSVNCEHPMSERADIVNSSRTYCLKCSTTL